MENIKEQGFINYYGLQRFGNDKEVPTYEIGVKLLQGKFKEVNVSMNYTLIPYVVKKKKFQACDLILKCKKCDNPVAEISQAKKVYVDTGDAANAVKLLKQKECVSVEAKLLYGLAKSNVNDYVNALENVIILLRIKLKMQTNIKHF